MNKHIKNSILYAIVALTCVCIATKEDIPHLFLWANILVGAISGGVSFISASEGLSKR